MGTLTLFGQPRLEQAGNLIDITSKKGVALIAYLAATPRHVASRETVGTLLWPDFDDGRARANLRNLLYSLNKTPFRGWVETDSEQLRLVTNEHTIDILQFSDCLARDNLATAVSYYKGPFLDGFFLADSEPFTTWQHEQRERYQRQTLAALHTLTGKAIEEGRWIEAEQFARRQIGLDNLQEPAWQQLMVALASNGRRAEALATLDDLTRLLEAELQIVPAQKTLELAGQIRDSADQSYLPHRPAITDSRDKGQQILLDKVNQFWIEGVLEQSLHGAALIELGLETRPDALAFPWGMVLQRPSQPGVEMPPGTSLDDIFQNHGRALLILGQPGSGKTTMLLDLAQSAIKRAQQDAGQPIPVVFNLSSWAQRERPLKTWLIEELNAKYLIPPSISQDWLNQDALLLLLDGLDEVRNEKQAACIQTINQFRQAHGLAQIVVCSRTTEYEAHETRLRLDTAVQLQPLTPAQIDTYLKAGGNQLTAVRTALQGDKTLQEMVASPLMLSIMTLAYHGLPLADLMATQSNSARQHHLFDTYVSQMAQRKGENYSYTLPQTNRWLSFLARKLRQQKQTIFLLEMLQPGWLDGRGSLWLYTFLTRMIGGLLIALLITAKPFLIIYGLLVSLLLALFTGYKFLKQRQNPEEAPYRLPIGKTLLPVLIGLLFLFVMLGRQTAFGANEAIFLTVFSVLLWLPFGLLLEWRDSKRTVWNDIQTVEILTWSWQRARRTTWRGMAIGTIGGTLMGTLLAVATSAQTEINLLNTVWPIVLFFGVPMGFAAGLLTGFSRDVISMKTTPDQGFRLTLRLILGGAVIGAIGIGLLFNLVLLLFARESTSPIDILQGVLFGASLGIRFGLLVGLWYGGLDLIYHFVLRLMLLLKHNLPFRLIAFLDAAAQHLFLRKVGGGYIFAHKLLLDYFAEL